MGKASKWLKALFGIKQTADAISNRRNRSLIGEMSLCDSYETIPPNISEREAEWLRTFYAAGEEEKERRTHAIAVAAATAAAADAAVAAAKAAAAVVKLSSNQGKSGLIGGNRAAVKIQCAFRSYLARKAFRALRGVVKIQALVRGYLVRKQAAATLRSMEALIRAQATVKFHRALRRITNGSLTPRKSTANFLQERFSGCLENRNNGEEETAKIVEVDNGTRPGSYKTRGGPITTGSDHLFENPFKRTLSSPLSSPRVPPRLSTPKPDYDEFSNTKFSTAQNTPRFAGGRGSCCSCRGSEPDMAAEANRLCFWSGDLDLVDTTTFRPGKLRSHSAPRQRPELNSFSGGVRRSTGGGGGGGGNSGGVRVRRPSCSGLREAVVGNIDRRRF